MPTTPQTEKPAEAPCLYLVDGMSQLYRAFYAIRGLSNSRGLPTNAIYGFITMLRRLLEQKSPGYLGVVLDPPGPTVRHQQFEQYKANRKPTPEELVAQIPYIHRLCQAMNLPLLQLPGYEADDVIGTLTAKAEAVGIPTYVVSLDKDMCQLVSGLTRLLDTRGEYAVLDREKVIEKMGVPPEKVIDLLSLWGDSSDNIPGAPGIGEKGALELIRRFQTLDECLARWAEVEKKTYRESLRDHADLIRQSRELVTIHRNLPVPLDLAQLAVGPPDYPKLAELYRELEFHSLLESIPQKGPEVTDLQAVAVQGLEDLEDFFRAARERGRFSFYLTSGEEVPVLCCAVPPARVYSLPCSSDSEPWAAFHRFLRETDLPSATFDLKAFWLASGLPIPGRPLPVEDVMLMGYLANPSTGGLSLQSLAEARLGGKMQTGTPNSVLAIDRLSEELTRDLEQLRLRSLYEELEKPLIPVLAHMESVGIELDVPMLREFSAQVEQDIQVLRRKIVDLAGRDFNLDSPKQVGEVLFEKLKLPVLKRTRVTKSHSTDQEVLEELAGAYEAPRLLLEYRQLAKLKSTYIDALPRMVSAETGRVHTTFNQTVAATGRLSSSNPNLQNIPIRTALGRKIRHAFRAADGWSLLAADYSQIELRVMAHLSDDEAMLQAFRSGEDIHARTAREVFGMTAQLYPDECRRRAKVINFGILYGLSAFGLAKELQISRPEAQRFIDQYFMRYPGVRNWIDATMQQAREEGQVRTLLGRIRPIPELKSPDKNVRSFGERAAINAPVQGTAADLIKLAMVRLHRALGEQGYRSRILLQVHDELVLEVPTEELTPVCCLVKEIMETVYPLKVPLLVETGHGRNWKETKG